MSTIRFQLFGKFSAHRDAQLLRGLDASKEQELLSYLLVHRDRSHPRETLASLLWGDTSTERSKKYLRQALWHLQTALEVDGATQPHVLLVEHDWVQIHPQSDLWLDVAFFEEAFSAAQGVLGKQLSFESAQKLKKAVDLYLGDLLEGWYEDWCIFERERLENMYLLMLDKLISYSEKHCAYEAGQAYGSIILRYDRARERTHRQLMHLQYLAGDRTAALRQYERCVQALDEELGVKPQRHTVALYEQICADRLNQTDPTSPPSASVSGVSLPEILSRLKRLQLVVSAVQKRIHRDIKEVEVELKTQKL